MKTILEVLGESSVRAIIISLTTACVLRVLRVKSPGICHRAWTGVLGHAVFAFDFYIEP